MENLLDEADAFLANDEVHPDFSVPEEYCSVAVPKNCVPLPNHPYLVIKEDPIITGRGLYAKQTIAAGTKILVTKPLGIVMDFERDYDGEDIPLKDADNNMDEEDDDDEPQPPSEPPLNDLLLIQMLKQLVDDPSLWHTTLSQLYPRKEHDLSEFEGYVCAKDDLFLQIETLLNQIEPSIRQAVSTRLPLILRYNVLSTETCPELLCYPSSDYPDLAGVALYGTASFFNHSSHPNVSRFSIGDVLFLYANREIQKDEQLFISYIEHEVLCEPSWRRNAMLKLSRMDFLEDDEENHTELGPDTPVVDSDLQNELMQTNPLQRLCDLDELLQQAKGEKVPEEQVSGMQDTEVWFQCDIHNLNILKAITLDGLGQHAEALQLWKTAVEFVQSRLPSLEESLVVLLVQAALSAYYCNQVSTAHDYANQALQLHNCIYGGGRVRFHRRLRRELELPLRPKRDRTLDEPSAVSILWPSEA